MKRVLITGASGLIGSMLAEILSNDYSLICLVRDQSKANANINARYVVADITDKESLLARFKGLEVDAIIHLAALNPLVKDKKLLRKVNLDGMRNMIELADMLHAEHFIYAQGMGVYANKERIDEDTPKEPDTEFSRIRLEAENMLLASKLKACIAIFGDVYGTKGWFKDIVIDRLLNNSFKIPGSGEYYRSFIHVYDAANGLRLLLDRSAEGDYIICDDNPAKFIDFIYYTAERLNVKKPKKVPAFLARAVLSSDMLRLLTRSYIASNSKMKRLGFKLRFPSYKEGVDDVLKQLNLI